MERSAIVMARMVRQREIMASALVEEALHRAEAKADLNAFITIDREGALSRARAVNASVAAGDELGPLSGVPIAVKDNINVAGLRTTAGTPGIDFVASASAPVVSRLEAAQAIVIGKTNLHELAFGVTSNNAAFGAVHNPANPTRVPGGSSGGTAAAIAAGIVPAGLGTDTGGSVRLPAALCGIVGLRPTTSRVDQAGMVPSIPTLDVVGPMARTVEDVALLNAVMTGKSMPERRGLDGCRFGIAHPQSDGLSAGVSGALETALSLFRQAGATCLDIDLAPIVAACFEVGFTVGFHEMRTGMISFLARYQPQTSLEEVVDRIASEDVRSVYADAVIGNGAPGEAAYREAVARIPEIRQGYLRVLEDHALDAVLFPTAPLEAQPIATTKQTVLLNGQQVPVLDTYIRNNAPTGVYGAPGLSIPIGTTDEGLPVGLELDGYPDGDLDLLAIGFGVEATLTERG